MNPPPESREARARSARILHVLDLVGVAVFAIGGAMAAMAAHLDLLGVLVLASITAVGGGTVRDLLLDRHPVFWIQDATPLVVIVASTVLTVAWVQFLPLPTRALLIVDALGLAVFALSGAQVAEAAGCRALVIVLMGTLTGVGGGLARDVLTAKVPLILQQDIYATAAMAGIALYLALRRVGVAAPWSLCAGVATVLAMRLAAIYFSLRLPSF